MANVRDPDPHLVVLDVGGTNISCAALSKSGLVIGDVVEVSATSSQFPTAAEQLVSLIGRIKKQSRQMGGVCTAAVVCIPGPFDYQNGVSLMRHKFADLYELDLKNFLLQETGIPPKFVNDVDAAGRGMWLGAGKPMGRIGCFTLGTGIGSSLLIDGLPLEEQHVADRPGQLWCSKYESGIFEDYVSSHAIRQNYLEIGGGESLTVHEIAELAASGDQVATEALENFGHHLGMAIAFFCDRFEPSRVLIGGKIALSWEQFGSKVQQQVVDSTEFWISADQNSAFLGALDLFPIEADAAEDKS